MYSNSGYPFLGRFALRTNGRNDFIRLSAGLRVCVKLESEMRSRGQFSMFSQKHYRLAFLSVTRAYLKVKQRDRIAVWVSVT